MYKRRRNILAIIMTLTIFITTGFAYGADEIGGSTKTVAEDFKVVGYYSGDLFNEPVDKLQTDKLTHIMYAFLIPTDDGGVRSLTKPEQLAAVVEKAHSDGAKVYIALGGWSYGGTPLVGTFEKVAADDTLRAKLVESVMNFVNENNLDGVEMDWEHPNNDSIANYEKLVLELSETLHSQGKTLTAAVNGAWSATAGPEVSKLLTDKCLNAFEFICVMGYDMNNEDHSPLWFGNTSINYWLNRGVAAEKIVLGMPLYARPSWIQYRDLVALDTENAYKDYVATSPNVSYYNGLNTLREKTRIALEKAGGVMLFDVNEDVDFRNGRTGKYSAVSEISEAIESMKGLTRSEIKNVITVVVNNENILFSGADGLGEPFIDENGRTLVPMRKVLEAASVDAIRWDNKNRTATAIKASTTVNVKIGEGFITVNDKKVTMDTEAVIKNGRTYLPARAVLEAFGYEVSWSNSSKTVYAAK